MQQLMQGYRGFIQGKTRILMAWIFVFLLGFFAREYPALPGVILAFVGASIRFWASGYLRKDRRPAVGGPYGLTRNPLYLGTWLMAVGVAWAIGHLWLLLAVTLIFAAVYHFIILDEENKLVRIFGKPYLQYRKTVPRFFPRLWPPSKSKLLEINPEPEAHRFSWPLANQNKAYEAYASFAGIVLFVSAAAYLWNQFG